MYNNSERRHHIYISIDRLGRKTIHRDPDIEEMKPHPDQNEASLGSEPDEVDNVASVGEVGDDAFLASFAKLLEALNGAFDLHQRHVACQLADSIDLRPVYIFIRVILEQVTPSPDVELTDEDLLALRSHAGEIHDVVIEYAAHYYLQ